MGKSSITWKHRGSILPTSWLAGVLGKPGFAEAPRKTVDTTRNHTISIGNFMRSQQIAEL